MTKFNLISNIYIAILTRRHYYIEHQIEEGGSLQVLLLHSIFMTLTLISDAECATRLMALPPLPPRSLSQEEGPLIPSSIQLPEIRSFGPNSNLLEEILTEEQFKTQQIKSTLESIYAHDQYNALANRFLNQVNQLVENEDTALTYAQTLYNIGNTTDNIKYHKKSAEILDSIQSPNYEALRLQQKVLDKILDSNEQKHYQFIEEKTHSPIQSTSTEEPNFCESRMNYIQEKLYSDLWNELSQSDEFSSYLKLSNLQEIFRIALYETVKPFKWSLGDLSPYELRHIRKDLYEFSRPVLIQLFRALRPRQLIQMDSTQVQKTAVYLAWDILELIRNPYKGFPLYLKDPKNHFLLHSFKWVLPIKRYKIENKKYTLTGLLRQSEELESD